MPDSYRFQIGDYACVALRDNAREGSLARVFSGVPEQEMQAALLRAGIVDDQVIVGYNVLYVNVNGHDLLVDTGSGRGELQASLAQAGIDPRAIATVILTHGDGDHIGGIADFPNARFALTPHAWSLWTNADSREQMVAEFIDLFPGEQEEERRKHAQRRAAYGADVLPGLHARLTLVEPEAELLPGIRLVEAPGHRLDHTAVEIRSGNDTLLHVVDALRHPLQIDHPLWATFIDSDPGQLAITNRRLLRRAAARNAPLFGAHLPFPGLLRISPDAKGLAWSTEANADRQ